MFLDWHIKEWGKWRPTADARRLGPVAIELERLVLRDHIEFEQAAETLISRGTALSREECDRAWAELPRRPARQRAGEQALDTVPSPVMSGDPIVLEEQRASAGKTRLALADAIPGLTPQEQLIIRLRFQDGITVAKIAQLIGEEQKPMYRRIEQILGRLRASLSAAGVTAEEVRDLLGNPAVELGAVFPAAGSGKAKVGPSRSSNGAGA